MIRVAMLSFWHVHAGDYLRQATKNPGTEVVAVWDEDPDRGRAKAAEIGVDFVEDLDTLLARDDIDAVINDTPTNIHQDVLVKAAKAGKHIFSEKVLAATLAEANAILAAVNEAGVVLTLSLPRLCDPYTLAIDEVIASGRLGRLTLARVRLSHGGAIANWLPEHFYSKEQCLGGALIDLGCHPMYLTARFLGGLPDTVSATYGYVSGREVEDSAVAVLSYPNSAIGVVEAGFVNKMNPFEIEIHGTEGSLFFGTPEAKLYVRAEGDEDFKEVAIGDRAPMAFEQWVSAIEDGGKTDENVARGLSLTKLMDAANRSADSGKAITVADLPA